VRDPPWAASRAEHEAGLLAAVAEIAPLPVPVPVFAVPEQGCTGHELVSGESLLDLHHQARLTHRRAAVAAVGRSLGRLLRALHDAPDERSPPLSPTSRGSCATWALAGADQLFGDPAPAGDTVR
jgi:aminoglycoside phosphotransferase (APT) family kinase protein